MDSNDVGLYIYKNIKGFTYNIGVPLNNFYGEYITGVCCIIGKNGAGKSNFIEGILQNENTDQTIIYYAPVINQKNLTHEDTKFINISEIHRNSMIDDIPESEFFDSNKKDQIGYNYDTLIKIWYLYYFQKLNSREVVKEINLGNEMLWSYDFSRLSASAIVKSLKSSYETIEIEKLELYFIKERKSSEFLLIIFIISWIELHFVGLLEGILHKIDLSDLEKSNFRNFFNVMDDDVTVHYKNIYNKVNKAKNPMTNEKLMGEFVNFIFEHCPNTRNYIHIRLNPKINNKDIWQFSSGDHAYFTFLGKVLFEIYNSASKGETKFLVLLDEVDIAIHPARQKTLFKTIVDSLNIIGSKFSKKKIEIKLVITTHSPFLASDIPRQNIIYLEKEATINDQDKGYTIIKKDVSNSFASNIHMLYKESFYLNDGLISDFAVDKITKEIVEPLESDGNITNSIKENIELIADPLLRERLTIEYFNKKNSGNKKMQNEELMEYYENRINKLKKEK